MRQAEDREMEEVKRDLHLTMDDIAVDDDDYALIGDIPNGEWELHTSNSNYFELLFC